MKIDELKKLLGDHKEELSKRFNVKEIGIFGSFVKNVQNEDSDLDVLVEFTVVPGLFKFIELEDYLTQVLRRKVDLVRRKALREELKDRILSETVYV